MINNTRKEVRGLKKGFTMIELTVVLSLLALMVSIAVPFYMSTRNEAEESVDDINIRTIESIVETYHSENGEYPEELSVLVEDYLERNPSNPFTGEVDGYELVVEGDEFEVRLKNGR